uniref:Uncharacterized protein n=1 Tax=Arundo donax TaxID=35708 RepID=A0A0A9ARG2_ARUDO
MVILGGQCLILSQYLINLHIMHGFKSSSLPNSWFLIKCLCMLRCNSFNQLSNNYSYLSSRPYL